MTLVGSTALALGGAGILIFLGALPPIATFALCLAFSAARGVILATLFATVPSATDDPRLAAVTNGLLMQGSALGQLAAPIAIGEAVDAFGWSAGAVIVGAAALTAAALARSAGRHLHSR